MRPQGKGNYGRSSIHQVKLWNVWITTVRAFSKPASWEETQQAQVPTEQIGTRLMEPRLATGAVHTRCGNFGVKYAREEYTIHLERATQENYDVTTE